MADCRAHGRDAAGSWQCNRAARSLGLCVGHYKQHLRYPGEPFRMLEARHEGWARITIRVPEATRVAIMNDLDGARAVLDAWCRARCQEKTK